MQFKPKVDLLVPDKNAFAPFGPTVFSYISIFKKDKKTLVYLCDDHYTNISFDMADFCFSDNAPAKPDVVVVEYENAGREPPWPADIQRSTLAYMQAIADRRGLPVVYADLSLDEMLAEIRSQNPHEKLTIDDVCKCLVGGPIGNDKYNVMDIGLGKARDEFMLKNIAAALNIYDNVLSVFGESHYRRQRLVLEDMLGKPEYIEKVPNTRGNFNKLEIAPVKLVQSTPTIMARTKGIEK